MGLKILAKEELTNRIAVIVGTRPGIIKFSPIIRALIESKINYLIIHTSQHYSYELDKIFFEELGLPHPSYRVTEMDKTLYHGEQTGHMLVEIEKSLLKEKPKVVFVGGDANTNLAAALAARKLGLYLVHLEAGLRSNDWRMPEEHNRVMIDHISEILLAPTKEAVKNLKSDNVRGKVFLVGNTISDAVQQNKEIAFSKSIILSKLGISTKNYILVTIHREENVDSPKILSSICKGLSDLVEEIDMPIIFPIHPRTQKRLKEFQISIKEENIKLIKPVGYFDFLNLLNNCSAVITDSGGIQEEACMLGIPCITVRESTERPETVQIDANRLVGSDPQKIVEETKKAISKGGFWEHPYGKDVAKKIVKILQTEFGL